MGRQAFDHYVYGTPLPYSRVNAREPEYARGHARVPLEQKQTESFRGETKRGERRGGGSLSSRILGKTSLKETSLRSYPKYRVQS